MKKEIGARIKIIRLSMDLTQEELASRIGITSQYLGQIEKGKNYLSIEKLKILCDITNLSADYILFGKPDNTNLNSRRYLKNLSSEQIEIGCDMLRNLAFFVKGN